MSNFSSTVSPKSFGVALDAAIPAPYSGGSGVAVASNIISLAPLGANLVLGNPTSAPAVPVGMTATQLATLIAPALAAALSSLVPTGLVSWFGNNAPPSGWLECDGSAVSRTTYADLFAAISTTYGSGDGTTTFNLPDLRGKFVRGWDHGAGVDTSRTFASLQQDAFQGHFHNMHPYIEAGTGGGETGSSNFDNITRTATLAPITDGSSGSPRTASETRPINVALLPCIKV